MTTNSNPTTTRYHVLVLIDGVWTLYAGCDSLARALDQVREARTCGHTAKARDTRQMQDVTPEAGPIISLLGKLLNHCAPIQRQLIAGRVRPSTVFAIYSRSTRTWYVADSAWLRTDEVAFSYNIGVNDRSADLEAFARACEEAVRS